MNSKILWGFLIISILVIGLLTWLLFATPAHAPTVPSNTTTTPSNETTGETTTPEASAPLHDRVIVTAPKSGATVAKQIAVLGEAPGNWYFEASFPIQVRDKDDNIIGRAHGSALEDWMTTKQVPFSASVVIESNYSGPATLIIMKDNPSGLPENDDSIEFPIVIKQ